MNEPQTNTNHGVTLPGGRVTLFSKREKVVYNIRKER